MAVTTPSDRALLGRYRVQAELGAGAFGRVLEVVDQTNGERRALKVGARDADLVLAEFEQLARLRHDALPRVFEVGRTTEAIGDVPAGAPFFVAEWIAGGAADARAWDARALWSLLADVGGALATIHAAGLVHGDVSPHNILVDGERAVLVDLGLAGAQGARGTPAYMAPEAYAGLVEARSDLYALGATAARLVLGHPPFEAASLGALVQKVVTAAAPPALPGLPRPLADLIGRLMARDLDARPASALALLDELDQLAPVLGVERRARPRVSAPPLAAAWPGAREATEALARALGEGGVHVIAGAPGSGARRIVDAAIVRWQLAAVAQGRAAVPVIAGSIDEVAAALEVNGRGRWLDRAARAVRAANAIVVIELGDDPRTRELLAVLGRGGDRPVIAIVDSEPEGVTAQRAPLLDRDGVRTLVVAMLGREPTPAWIEGLHVASGGLPLTAVELVRSLADEPDPFAVDWSARATAGSAELRARQLRVLAPAARGIVLALAAHGGRARLERVLAVAPTRAGDADAMRASVADVAAAERAGLVRRRGDELAIDRATIVGLELDAGAELAAIARAALDLEPAPPLDAQAALLSRAPLDATLAARACDVAEQLLARGRADRARTVAARAIELAPARAGLLAARAAAALGHYREVAAFAEAAEAAGADRVDAQLVVARAAQRAGDLDASERVLAALHAAQPQHADVAGAYARLLVTRARFAEARTVAAVPASPLAGLRAEAAGLAAFYLGELDDADRAFAALEVGGAAAGDDATVGRALSMRGMVAQQRGQLGLASDRYREAARRLADVGELHAAATAELNLGTALSERGRASEALPRLAAAARVFADLGATTELVAADLNRAFALVHVGELAAARAAAEGALARGGDTPHLRAFALLAHGDALFRLGDRDAAERSYREALAIGIARGDAHAQASAQIALAEAGLAPGAATGAAPASDTAIEALCASADDRDRWTHARARRALRRGEPDLALARACADVGLRAAEHDRIERAFRAHAVASALAQRSGDAALARAQADRARAAHAAMVTAAAPAFRAALEADPDLALVPIAPRAAEPVPRAGEHAHMRRLLTLSRRLNTEASVDRILDEVIDTAIELTAAERGFLLLRQPTGGLEPVVSRNFASADLTASEGTAGAWVSRSIAERAAQSGEPVLTVDAGVDERFAIAASVAALRLRSVLAVPLRQRGTIIGCIYVDHRLRGGAFDDTATSVLGELADIAAIAIENARLTDALVVRSREVEALNLQLGSELADKDAELVRVKAELPDRDRLRHRYDRIVGRSPAIARMLGIIDRAAATSLPVVIVGESGTGKELVARALHDTGPRKAGPFVAVNCSAVPEPLLESELFGHVRGAFTGADRDRRGLFEVADGGTLFLDEIADTSAAMQAKLLRVLQDGIIRRVGDNKTRKVDVRVIAAAQRPLAELVEAGAFREDLRFRLEVIAVPVPALRERVGDIPLLVEHLLAQLSKKPPRLTRAALRALGQHRWPGNVRELENALARGVAMGGDVIDLPDLPDAIAATAARPEPQKPAPGDDLHLKPALVATEQAYIAEAMARAKNNQTVAARLLGLSRFGLQKKLRRLSGEDVTDDD
jgi:transcriptional regulator with GAF, ATPase, and Fis domain/tetratricopeptide (TPR) repeat protein